jgi:hypothetical protein
MTSFDRLAWRCSWVAPWALFACLGAILLDCVAAAWKVGRPEWREYLPIVALCSGCVGIVAHVILQYHVVRAGSFAPDVSRSRLEVALRFNTGYAFWRDLMRVRHPELRSAAGHAKGKRRA